jgi:hypothetical protein
MVDAMMVTVTKSTTVVNLTNETCSEILQETLLISVSNNLLPFMVGQS